MERNHFSNFFTESACPISCQIIRLDRKGLGQGRSDIYIEKSGYALVELLAYVAILSLIFASGVSSASEIHKHLQRSRIVRSWQQALQSCVLYASSYQETLTIRIPEWLKGELRCGNAPPPRPSVGWNSSRTELRFYPSGVVSPASIQIDFTGLPPCIVKLSLRGRIRYICGS